LLQPPTDDSDLLDARGQLTPNPARIRAAGEPVPRFSADVEAQRLVDAYGTHDQTGRGRITRKTLTFS
jgi:hypothetical protein